MAAPATLSPDLAERDARFVAEAAHFALRYRCPACAHVLASTLRCSMGFPNAHLLGTPGAFQPDGEVAFCKYFELSESSS